MKFQNEIISNNTRSDTLRYKLAKFMTKHSQRCKAHNWKSQRIHKLRLHDSGTWGTSFIDATISLEDFLKKYDRKRISFKTIL